MTPDDLYREATAVELAAQGREAQARRGRERKPPIPDDVIERDLSQAALLRSAAEHLRYIAGRLEKRAA